MITGRLSLTALLAALALSACAQAAVPVASTAKGSGRPAVAASGAGTWFAPEPANPHDLLALAEPNARWTKAAAATSVFQLSGASIAALSDADLAGLGAGLKRDGLPVAVLLPALTPVANCGQLPGRPAAGAATELLRRLVASGASVSFVAMEKPAVTASSCHISPEQTASNIAAWINGVRALLPRVAIGDAETLATGADANTIAAWMPAYAAATGKPLAFLHLDLDWSAADWVSRVAPLQAFAGQQGIGFGIVERGNPDDSTDALWVANAADRMAAVASSGVQVDSPVFESWPLRSPRLLPESDDSTFSALLNRYAGTRTVLTLDRPNAGSDGGGTATGKLADAAGAPIAGAGVTLTVRSLNAAGDFAPYTVSGIVPAGVDRALVGIRLDNEGADPGPADLAVYHAGYQEGALGKQRIANPDFAAGSSHWGSTNPDLMRIEPSDRGAGQMLHVVDPLALPLQVNSDLFPVTAGSAFTLTIDARVAPVSRGYFALMFVAGTEVSRTVLRFAPAVGHLSAVSDAGGRLQWSIPASSLPAELDARYTGDLTRWPAFATATS